MMRCVLLAVLLVPGCDAGAIDNGGDSSRDGGAAPGIDASDEDGDSTAVPLGPNDENSSGVTVDGDGNLVLDPGTSAVVFSHIWIANSPDGTVSKIDTETGTEVARYRTGPGTPDPSRTTVGLDGDVVVANRGGASATRIHSDPAGCPDKNGNGEIETSSGPTDILAWGTDECVLWYKEFPAGGLARAAAYDFAFDPDGIPHSTIWVGMYSDQKLHRLDNDTGEIVATIDIPGHCPYGLAFDGYKHVYAFSACSASLLKVDIDTLDWTATPLPGGCAYGITVDGDGYVWTSGGSCVGRYDPVADNWQTTTVGSSNRGLAADGDGSIWVADTNYGVHRIDAETMATLADIPLGSRGFVGMAVDFHGKVWAVARSQERAYRIDPATLATTDYPTGSSPYTYSDMTGFQLQNAAPPLGIYRAIVEGCGPETQWLSLSWTADTVPGTFVRFAARAADDTAGLAAEDFVHIARQPGDLPPADLQTALEAAQMGGSFGSLLELEITPERPAPSSRLRATVVTPSSRSTAVKPCANTCPAWPHAATTGGASAGMPSTMALWVPARCARSSAPSRAWTPTSRCPAPT